MRKALLALLAFGLLHGTAPSLPGQWGGGRGSGGEGWLSEDAPLRTAREVPGHSVETPTWRNDPGFERDVWTFARLRYHRNPYGPRRAGYCFTDFPDSDLNFSWRLQQLTSLRVDPDGRVLRLTDPDLSDHPFLYVVEPGGMDLEPDELKALGAYLRNGGFLMADDFWGPLEWGNFEQQIRRALPGAGFVELPMDHPVFHSVFDLGTSKNALQTPNFRAGENSQYTGVTWEYHDGEECREVHIRAVFDERGRMMVIACHNTDNGDGWEREQEYQYFFREFSEKRAYPLGVNILVYTLTH